MTEQGNRPDDAIRVPGTDRVFNRQLMLVPLLAILAMTMMAISSINVALPSIELSIGASEASVTSSGRETGQDRMLDGRHSRLPRCDVPSNRKPPLP